MTECHRHVPDSCMRIPAPLRTLRAPEAHSHMLRGPALLCAVLSFPSFFLYSDFSKNFNFAAWLIISNHFSFQNSTKIFCLRIALVAQNPIPRTSPVLLLILVFTIHGDPGIVNYF